MSAFENLCEAELFGCRKVRAGDAVCIKPASLMKEYEGDKDHAKKEFESLRQWLGKGPFIISSIIIPAPASKAFLYLKDTKVPNSVVCASHLI